MTRMTDTKSVKVDNWGVFFLQKLQNFFNKTDHCDLTLQFNDNSQLKVHRLVLSACTDYFNMLENTCEMYEDVLIMPLDLQADVIVPIVNFMYTGTLEFQYNMYEKLLKTARDMNMTVLLKLLEAHKQTTRLGQGGRQPVLLNKQAPVRGGRPVPQSNVTYQMPPTVARNYGAVRQAAPAKVMGAPQRVAQIAKQHASVTAPMGYSANKSMSVPEPHTLVSKYGAAKESKAGPSRFEENSLSESLERSFDDISYESKPLVTADQIKKEEETSPFEKLRKGYTNVNIGKRPAPISFSTPVAKKPNLEEVKEFTEAARLRSQMATEEDDSPGFADDTRFDDDEEEEQGQQQATVKSSPKTFGVSPTKQIVIKQEQRGSPNSSVKQITVKDESGNVDHAKIISEVLKKYPHLVKKNKNIKLKIMQKTSPSNNANTANQQNVPVKMEVRTATPLKTDISMIRRATEVVRQAPTATSTPAPKKIDSKTMHALIAKGAENMTGPWLCLRCGIDGRPISIPSYKAFRNHLIVKHKEKIDARICEHCGWRAEQRNPHLFYHWLTEHNIKSTIKFPSCAECDHVAINASSLQKHEDENHPRGDFQQCIYCNKVFAKEMDLYEHMKSLHKERAREDGVIDFSDDEYHVEEEEDLPQQNSSQENKIKILSNISITNNSGLPFVIDASQAQTVSQIGGKSQLQLQQITLEPSSEAEALSNVASGIATSLGLVDNSGVVIEDGTYPGQFIEHQMATVHGETGTTTTITAASGPDQLTKLITEDGTELQLTQSQKEEIFSQLQNSGNGNVVMVLNDDNFIGGSGLHLEDGTQLMNASGGSLQQDSNIVVMYSQAGDDMGASTHTTITTTSAPTVVAAPVSQATEQQVVHEDETSQASTQPSEKVVSEREGEEESQQMMGDAESSQEVPTEEKDESKEADMSADSEVLQQIVEQETDEENSKPANEEEKVTKEREKLKLISELEGDWSEDTEEQQNPAEEKKENKASEPDSGLPQNIMQDEAVEESPSKPEQAETSEVTKAATPPSKEEGKLNDKEISELLDDWNNETKFTESDSDADLEKKLEKVVGEKKVEGQPKVNEEEEQVAMETSTADNTADSVDDSMNDSETRVVIMAAESETETSTRDEDAAAGKSQDEKEDDAEEKPDEKEEEETKDDDDKAKSKEVVNSLLGDWDEDDDL